MQNPFLEANLGTLDKLDKHLIELELLGSYQEFPINTIRGMFRGLQNEVAKLQGEVDELTKLAKAAVTPNAPAQPTPPAKQKVAGK